MDELTEPFRAGWLRHDLPTDARLVVAVSGGVDSMVLLDLLRAFSAEFRLKLIVAHVNHQLRGKDSAADANFVQTFSQRLGLACHTTRVDVRAEMTRTRESLEMTARRLRHAFLARIALEHSAPYIALAHHADDQVELFFLRLLRGAGGEGLGGMRCISPSPADPRITLIRPLFGHTKEELNRHASVRRLEFREDASNQDGDLPRNRIRHELLPLLTNAYSPGIRRIALRTAELVGDEADFVRGHAERWLRAKRRTRFDGLHPAVQRAVLRLQLWQLGHTAEFDLIEELRLRTTTLTIGGGAKLRREETGRLVAKTPVRSSDFSPGTLSLDITGKIGAAEFAGVRLKWRIKPLSAGSVSEPEPFAESFDADKLGSTLLLRHWQPGDRFQPLGFQTASKVQNLLVNRKIPAAHRRKLVVAETERGELCWIEGLPPGEAFKVTGETRRRLMLGWQRHPSA